MNAVFLQDLANKVTICHFWLLALLAFTKCNLSAVLSHYIVGLFTSPAEHMLLPQCKNLLPFAAEQTGSAHTKPLLWLLGLGSLTCFPVRSRGTSLWGWMICWGVGLWRRTCHHASYHWCKSSGVFSQLILRFVHPSFHHILNVV